MDREKVIKALECCTTALGCVECPYAEGEKCTDSCKLQIDRDALALLKAQEPVEPTIGRAVEHDGHDSWWYQCGKCEKPIDWQDNYCRHCGRAVKWE